MSVTVRAGPVVDVETAARLFHSLSDPTRLAILLSLQDGERCVSDLVATIGSSQSNVSNHLACLKGCGLVVDRPGERRQVLYRIATNGLADLLGASERLLAETGVAVELCRNPSMQLPSPTRRGRRNG
jgi:DNA-binding transcriptional ArsR family regulator